MSEFSEKADGVVVKTWQEKNYFFLYICGEKSVNLCQDSPFYASRQETEEVNSDEPDNNFSSTVI